MIREFEPVVFTVDLPQYGLLAGDVGTVADIHPSGKAYEVEVFLADGSTYDAYGRLHIRTTGKGKAELYRDGRKMEITWKRAAGTHIQFESLDGSDVLFDRGTTWIEVVMDAKMYAAAVGGKSFNGPAPTGSATSTSSTAP